LSPCFSEKATPPTLWVVGYYSGHLFLIKIMELLGNIFHKNSKVLPKRRFTIGTRCKK
jgi:hypothetical protein